MREDERETAKNGASIGGRTAENDGDKVCIEAAFVLLMLLLNKYLILELGGSKRTVLSNRTKNILHYPKERSVLEVELTVRINLIIK